ncbi:deoxycytidylate deaminase [Caudoviricetes sp.]|nr:deoxycytidylate deaminase [Caudoviricetes sp.]
MRKKIYISGPMTGMPDLNRKTFTDAEELLHRRGYEPVNPHKNGLPDTATWEDHMKRDLEMLNGCDGVAVLWGCDKSKGSQIEMSAARRMSMPVETIYYWLR